MGDHVERRLWGKAQCGKGYDLRNGSEAPFKKSFGCLIRDAWSVNIIHHPHNLTGVLVCRGSLDSGESELPSTSIPLVVLSSWTCKNEPRGEGEGAGDKVLRIPSHLRGGDAGVG